MANITISNNPVSLTDLINELPIPSLPIIVMQVTRAAKEEDFPKLVKLIETDATLATHTLKLANSAFYTRNLNNPVQSIKHALLRIGMNTLAGYLLTHQVKKTLLTTPLSEDLEFSLHDYWRYSFSVGISAGIIHQGTPADKSIATACGLLHNIGEVILKFAYDQKIIKRIGFYPIEQRLQAETDLLGFNHAELSAAVLLHWDLDPIFATSAQYCTAHENAPEHQPIIKAIATACILQQFGPGTPGHWQRHDPQWPEWFPTENAAEWMLESENRIEQTLEIINLK